MLSAQSHKSQSEQETPGLQPLVSFVKWGAGNLAIAELYNTRVKKIRVTGMLCCAAYAECSVLCSLFEFKVNIHFLHHLNQLFLQILVAQGCICAKYGRYRWSKREFSETLFPGVAIRAGKELCDTCAANTLSRAIKCVLHVFHL